MNRDNTPRPANSDDELRDWDQYFLWNTVHLLRSLKVMDTLSEYQIKLVEEDCKLRAATVREDFAQHQQRLVAEAALGTASDNLPTTKDSDWLELILDRFDPFDNSHNEFLRRKPQAKAQVQAHVQRLVIEGRIKELQQVKQDQINYIKAVAGHIRNNNSWPHNRGTGKASQNFLAWIDRRLADLENQLTELSLKEER